MPLIALAGLPGTGKTTQLIRALKSARDDGRSVSLFLCSESEELRSRPHVREGGTMGCRTPNLAFQIDHFVSADRAAELLREIPAGSTAAFDEASWFGTGIVDAWIRAAANDVNVIVSSISEDQARAIESAGETVTRVTAPCMLCGVDVAAAAIECFVREGRCLIIACDACHAAVQSHRGREAAIDPETAAQVTDDLRRMQPFAGEDHAYQPIYGLDLPDWEFVRPDSQARASLCWETLVAYLQLPAAGRPRWSYLDAGCCTGYFCEDMARRGLLSEGVDIDHDFIQLARRMTTSRGSGVTYHQSRLEPFVDAQSDRTWDVISSFATIQWVMAQKGAEEGLRCLDWVFSSARRMCILELGYTEEDIYKDKLPFTIDREWILDRMRTVGSFDEVILFEKGTRGIWRDLFIGIREPVRRPAQSPATSVGAADAPAGPQRSLGDRVGSLKARVLGKLGGD